MVNTHIQDIHHYLVNVTEFDYVCGSQMIPKSDCIQEMCVVPIEN